MRLFSGCRSGAGWGDEVPDRLPVSGIRNAQWFFSPSVFNQFVTEIEAMTSWTYSGGTDIIITNARYNAASKTASLDFSSALAIDLDKAKKEEAIQDIPHLIETIFEFVKNLNEDIHDPAFVYSDRHGHRIIRSSLKNLLLSFLPKPFQPEARRAFHFIAQDIGRVSQHS
jgi:hypothetical protein